MSAKLPPGRLGLPIVGDTLRFLADPLAYMQRRASEHGLAFKAGIIGKPTVFLLGPRANEFVLGTHVHDFSWREGYGPAAAALFGSAMIMRDGDDYAAIKRALLPAFAKERLAAALPDMTTIIADTLDAACGRGPVDLYPLFKQMALRVALRVLVGVDVGQLEAAQLVVLFNRFSAGLFTPFAARIPGSAFARAWRARDQLRGRLGELLARPGAREGEHAAALLLAGHDANGRPLELDDVVAQLVLLLFAGHDTTASLSTWLAFELMRREDVRERARAELRETCGDAAPNLATLARLDFVTACIREAERLYPPAPTGFRGVTRTLEYDEFTIPRGFTVVYSPLFTHHMPEIYPQPERYEPERFMRPSERPGYSLIGFGGGLRKCVGEALAQLELKLFVATWLTRFDATPLDTREPGWDYIPALHPKGGLRVQLARRS